MPRSKVRGPAIAGRNNGGAGETVDAMLGWRVSLAERKDSLFENHLRECLFRGVRERKCDVGGSEFGRELRRLAVQYQGGASTRFARYFEVAPAYPMIPSSPDSLHARFFRRKPCGVTFHAVRLRFAVLNLAFRKNTFQEPLPMALKDLTNPRHFCHIDARSHDHAGTLAQRGLQSSVFSRQRLTTND